MTRSSGRRPLRVGLAGLGMMGRNHLRNLLARDDVTLVAVADPSPGVASEPRQADQRVRGFAQPPRCCAEEQLDALSSPCRRRSTSRSRCTRSPASRCSSRSPSPRRSSTGSSSCGGDGARRPLAGRSHRAVQPVLRGPRGPASEGRPQRIYSIKTIRGGPLPERIRDVGVAIDLATHDIDIMCHLLGERPVRVSAEGSRQSTPLTRTCCTGCCSFPSGIVGLLDVNWLTPEKQRRVVVLGEEGMFQADYLTQTLTFTRGAATLAPTTSTGTRRRSGVTCLDPRRRGRATPAASSMPSSMRSGRVRRPTSQGGWADAPRVAKLLLIAADEGRSLPSGPSRHDGMKRSLTAHPGTSRRPVDRGDRGTTGTVAVVGLGKIGLPLAAQYAAAGWNVIGVDVID